MSIWDCVIVGAGPAGLSAAVYMGRFRRRTLVLDAGDGRWSYGQRNDNYLGFPGGISARRLHHLGKAQAERFGVRFREARVTRARVAPSGFQLHTTPGGSVTARTVIWATGVSDLWPDFPAARRLVGKQLFWCIVCDGWRTLERRVLLLGDTERAVGTALQFLTYTRGLTFLMRAGARVSRRCHEKLATAGITALVGEVARVRMGPKGIEAVLLEDGRTLEADLIFSLFGSRPRTELLSGLPVALARNGHVRSDDKSKTSLPGFFAAGDVNNRHSHQVVSAAHEGAAAAQAANHALYPPLQLL